MNVFRAGLAVICLGLAGCSSSGQQSPSLALAGAGVPRGADSCTDIIATSGGILKFCQTEKSVDVYESGLPPEQARTDVQVVDNPKVLAALQGDLSLRPDLADSRRIIAKACIVQGRKYLNISMESLTRILRRNGAQLVARDDRAEPVATGSLDGAALGKLVDAVSAGEKPSAPEAVAGE